MSEDFDDFKAGALRYHREPTPGKLAITPTKPMANKRDLALAYSPGVAYPCEAIAEDPNEAANYTVRGNLVGVVTNGTAVLGLGAIGPLASKPVMEGKAVLFKKFANIDVFDIEIDETDQEKLVDIIASLEPTFGGINLEDIKSPECFYVEKELRKRMNIPVFHDDQHGTAIVSAAAIYNGLRIVNKQMNQVKLVSSGGGAACIACLDLLVSMGMPKENITICDRQGVVHLARDDSEMNEYKAKYARDTEQRTLSDAIADADIFLGLSAGGVLKPEMVVKMAPNPLILAMANPYPEILPEEAKAVRPDAIIATGRSDYPNQVNNVLCFPFIFRGALDCGATTINEAMKMACVKAIADMALKESHGDVAAAYVGEELTFGPEYLIPKPFDPRLIEELPVAVVKAAMESGVASRPIEDLDAYRAKLHSSVCRSGLFMQPMIEAAKKAELERLVYAEGENSDVLRAVQGVVDENIAFPILIGRPQVIQAQIDKLGLRLQPGKDFELFNPQDGDHHEEYWQFYHAAVGRNGMSTDAAKKAIRSNATVLGAVMVARGEADGLICGKVGRFDYHLRDIRDVIGPRVPDQHITSVGVLLLDSGPLFIADPFICKDPSVDEVVEITRASIERVRHFGVEPRVALLSHSNFGTSNLPSAIKMRKAAEILRESMPDVELDGEMHAMSAMNLALRNKAFQGSTLKGQANLLVMPNLDAANISMGMIRSVTDAMLVGPFISGLAQPAQIMIPSITARGIFNLSAATAADIQKSKADDSKHEPKQLQPVENLAPASKQEALEEVS